MLLNMLNGTLLTHCCVHISTDIRIEKNAENNDLQEGLKDKDRNEIESSPKLASR